MLNRPGGNWFSFVCLTLAAGAGFGWNAVWAASAIVWEPIPAEHKSARPPPTAPDAPAEVLYTRINLVAKDYKSTQRTFQRIKIYSDRATEALGKLGLEYSESERVSELGARVVHPDGQIVVLPESQFVEIVLDRRNHARRMARRLVVPRLAAGDILELQWRVDQDGRFKSSRFIYCQETIPVRKFEFLFRNYQSGPMNLANFGAAHAKMEGMGTDRGKVVMTDLPAYVEEKDMPPPFNVRASILLVYGEMPLFENEIWKYAVAMLKLAETVECAVTPDLRKTADQLTAGLKYRDEQLRKIYEYCQNQVTNTAYDESAESRAERIEYHQPRTAQEVWKARRGDPLEINCLFTALASAAGFGANLSFSADSDEVMDAHFSHGWFFMKSSGVMTKVGGEWRMFAPGDRMVPFGQCRWQRDGTETVLVDDDDYIRWYPVETMQQIESKQSRRGRLELNENGGLAGEISETFEGPMAIAWREQHWNETPQQLERSVRKDVQTLLPEAEITNIRVEHLQETGDPLVLHYLLRLANYATTTGDHWVIIPAVFHLHAQPRYSEPTRVNPIRWQYPWKQEDQFDLVLPRNFEVESADPPPMVYESNGILHHQVTMDFDAAGNCLHYHREQTVGRRGAITFPENSYPALQQLFNLIYRAQTHAVVLRRKADEAKPTDDVHP